MDVFDYMHPRVGTCGGRESRCGLGKLPEQLRVSKQVQETAERASATPLPLTTESKLRLNLPTKEAIYDLEGPQLHELKRKLLESLQAAASPSRQSRQEVIRLLSLVELEIRERESCAHMINNILTIQSAPEAPKADGYSSPAGIRGATDRLSKDPASGREVLEKREHNVTPPKLTYDQEKSKLSRDSRMQSTVSTFAALEKKLFGEDAGSVKTTPAPAATVFGIHSAARNEVPCSPPQRRKNSKKKSKKESALSNPTADEAAAREKKQRSCKVGTVLSLMNGATKRRWQQSCSVAVEKWTSKGGAICSSRSTVADEAEKDSGSEDRKTICSIETAGGHGQSANSICSLRRYVSSRRTSEERDTLELAEEPATQRNGSHDTSEPFSVRNEPHIQTSSKNNQCVTVSGKREAPDDLKLDNSSATGTLENVDNAETSRRSKDKRCANVDAPVAIVSDKSVSGGQCFSRGTRRSASVTANFTPVAHVSKKRLEDGLCQEAHDNGSSTSRSSKNPDLDSFCRRQETLSECGRQRTRQAISESGEDNRKGLHRARSMCTASLERHRRSRLGIDSKHERKPRAGRTCPYESTRVAGRGNGDDVSLFLFVDHESAHQSIRNSAQGAIGALAAALESIQTRIPPDSKDEIIRQEVNPASELLVGSSAALGIEYEKPRTQAQSGHMTVQQEQRSNDENSGDVTGGRSEDQSQDNCHCSDLDVEDFLENQRYNEQQSKIKDEKHTPSSTPPAEATMETVYRLLAVVDAHRTRNINHQSQGSLVPNPPCDLAWKIEMGNDDLVDAVNQTISIKQKDGEECHDNIIIIPERGPEIWTDCVPPTLSNQSQRAYQWDAMCRPASLITGTETDSSVAVSLGLSKNCQSSCRPPSAETELMRDYYRHFPTLGDLLTEPDRSKHCDIFKEILVSNGKCCADIQTAATLSPSIKGDENTTKSQLGDILHSRYFKVEKSRPEVYRIVSSAFQKVGGWKTLPETPHWEYAWNLLWTWHRPRIDYNRLLSFQKVNHFPESRQLTRKDNLKRCIERFQKAAGRRAEHFRIIPKTFLLPKEYTAMVSEMCEMSDCPTKQKRVWICKPKDSSRGRGIFLTNSVEDIRYTDNLVVQEYIANPLLLNGRKFDLRLYVLVTSFNPLEAFVYKQGFARVARVPFTLDPEHLDNRFMHLTNAAIQSEWQEVSSDSDNDAAPPRSPASALSPWRHRTSKQRKSVLDSSPRGRGVPRSEGFVGASFTVLGVDSHGAEAEAEKRKYTKRSRPQEEEDEGISKGNHEAKNEFSSEDSKILLDELRQRLEQNGVDWDAVWQKVLFVILKSLSCCGDSIPHHPNAFELFGYDVLIDTDLRPWLIEVNSSPSMGQEHEADRKVKPGLIEDTLRLVNPISYDRLKLSEIIAGRLSEAMPNEAHPVHASPRRPLGPSHQKGGPSESQDSGRQGMLTHRPKPSDVDKPPDRRRTMNRRLSKEQHIRDLCVLFRNARPREYGEMPANLGQYERIAPSKMWCQLQTLMQTICGRNQQSPS